MDSLKDFAWLRDEGESYWIFGDLYTFKLTGAESGGALTVVETLTFPQNGPPLHTHTHEDEMSYILEGRFVYTLGDHTLEVGPGAFLFAPRDIPHCYRNISALPARKLLTIAPAGLENFFREIGDPALQRATPPAHRPGSIRKALEAASRYGLRFQLPEDFSVD